jgi:hypothetical protein
MSIEVMKQALEALEDYVEEYGPHDKESGAAYVITALRQAIEQAEKQEPVAWVCYGSATNEKHAIDYDQTDIDDIPVGTMLYTAPPQRQPLTDEEIERLYHKHAKYQIEELEVSGWQEFARAIEAAHGIRE